MMWQSSGCSSRDQDDYLAALEVEKAQQRASQQAVRRRAVYNEALAASATAGAELTPELRLQISHVSDLLVTDPEITALWIKRGSQTARLVGPSNAEAHIGMRTIVVPPITDEVTTSDVLHEIGHIRTPWSNNKIERETRAWRWERDHALIVNLNTLSSQRAAMGTYMANADPRFDSPFVHAAEAFLSEETFLRDQRTITAEQIAAFGRRQFLAEHGLRGCQFRSCGLTAVALVAELFVCARCKVDAEIAAAKRQRARHETVRRIQLGIG